MRITKKEDVKVGHWVTIISTRKEYIDQSFKEEITITERRFYKVVDICNNDFHVITLNKLYKHRLDDFYDTVINNLFECEGDEVVETLDEMINLYPEEFL